MSIYSVGTESVYKIV